MGSVVASSYAALFLPPSSKWRQTKMLCMNQTGQGIKTLLGASFMQMQERMCKGLQIQEGCT